MTGKRYGILFAFVLLFIGVVSGLTAVRGEAPATLLLPEPGAENGEMVCITYLDAAGNVLAQYMVTPGEAIEPHALTLNVPEGYVFLHWAAMNGDGNAYEFDQPVWSDLVLTPVLMQDEGANILLQVEQTDEWLPVPDLSIQEMDTPADEVPMPAEPEAAVFSVSAYEIVGEKVFGEACYQVERRVSGTQGETDRWHGKQGTDPILYDAALDAYYLPLEGLPYSVMPDLFDNEYVLFRNADSWCWRYTENGAVVHALTERDGRWIFGDGFNPNYAQNGTVYVSYRSTIEMYEMTLLDEDGSRLKYTFPVMAGGSLAKLPYEENNILSMLPADRAFALAGWDVHGGVDRPDYPDALRAPITLIARYAPVHEVAFFVHDVRDVPFCRLQVAEGRAVDWSLVPVPVLEEYVFVDWYLIDAISGASYGIADPELPIVGYTAYLAMLEDKLTVTFLDGHGGWLAERKVAQGGSIDLLSVPIPAREGLTFSHWEDEYGIVYAPTDAIWTATVMVPVYNATVTFMDGGVQIATRTVRTGYALYDLPDTPSRTGYMFTGWDPDPSQMVIEKSITVQATYTAVPSEAQADDGAADASGGGATRSPRTRPSTRRTRR